MPQYYSRVAKILMQRENIAMPPHELYECFKYNLSYEYEKVFFH